MAALRKQLRIFNGGINIMYDNSMKIEFVSKSQNESFARVAVAAFVSQLDPTIEELTDVKTAVSEAVTNSIIHGYENKKGIVKIEAFIEDRELTLIIEDEGIGIENIELARQPLYTSRPDLERSGMGFTVMETFMDSLKVESKKNKGTRLIMKKVFNSLS
jgi:stage II sporulation protein AB (anti-sigma F factor)